MIPCTVITGAAGALGSTVARHLVAMGHQVAAVDVPAAAGRLEALTAELSAAPGPSAATRRCLAIPLDVTSAEGWAAALSRVEVELAAPTGGALIAGGWRGGVPMAAETDDAVFRAMFAMNVETTYQSLRALLRGMVARRAGSLVVVGLRAVEQPWTSAGAAAYAASKSAVVRLAQAVAAEVLESGVRVNAILPSTIDTPANRAAMPDADPSRWVEPLSLARVIAFLLSDDARDVSGAAIPVYGRA